MTQDKFGEPSAGDPTSFYEQSMESVAQRAAETLRTIAPQVLNRGPGTHPISREDQFLEYVSLKADPQLFAQKFEALIATPSIGRDRAELIMLRLEKEARKGRDNA